MRTTADIGSRLLRRLRSEAHRQGVLFKDFLIRVLHRGLKEQPEGSQTVYECTTFGMGAPLRPLDKALTFGDAPEDEEVAREMTLRK